MTNEYFGLLKVIEKLHKYEKGSDYYYRCICECGKEKIALGGNLRSGKTKSCGCMKYIWIGNKKRTHGLHGSKLYNAYNHMINRCYSPNCDHYKTYGGRGIKVCNEWNWKEIGWELAFKNFIDWAFKNGFSTNLTLDRKDNDKDYCPENCRWITKEEQAKNKTTSRKFTYNGVTKIVTDWAKDSLCRVCEKTLFNRLYNGWSFEKALLTPNRNKLKSEGDNR